MVMSKEHFELIARVIKRAVRLEKEREQSLQALADVAFDFATECARANPNFNRARFLAACGVE